MSLSTEDVAFHEFTRQANSLISYYLAVPFPEDLADDVWAEKWKQVEWLIKKKVAG